MLVNMVKDYSTGNKTDLSSSISRKLQSPLSNPGFVTKALLDRFLYKIGLKKGVKLDHDSGGVHPVFNVSICICHIPEFEVSQNGT